MSTSTAALVTRSAGAPFERTTIERRALRADDVLIEIRFAGICHSDIHTAREEWGAARFPLVPGHEIAGVVAQVGDAVTRVKVGDRVGVGCMVDSCGECAMCKDGQEQFCERGATMTYGSVDRDGEVTYGGYSQAIVVTERFVCRIPDALSFEVAAPLLCAGITTYAPLTRWGAGPGKQVAVIGMGGLGHVGVKIAAALGAEVTVLSRSLAKKDDAVAYGAAHHYSTAQEATFEELAGRFDVILNTVSADLPMGDYLGLLRPFGALVSVGMPSGAYEFGPGAIVGRSKVLAGSMIGGIADTQEMLDFCAAQGIGAEVEVISADEVDEAYDRVVAGDVRYRYVIDVASIAEAS